jgi:hypothetical protein
MSTGFSFPAFDFFISLIFIFKRNMLHLCESWFIITLSYWVLVLCLECPMSTWLSILNFDISISLTFVFALYQFISIVMWNTTSNLRCW